MRTILAAVFAATLVPAAAQTQTPAPPGTEPAAPAAPAAEPPKPRPPLKLQLDESDMRSLMTFTPKDDEKRQDTGLPALGGNPSPTLERKPSEVVPKDQTPGH